jgi:hypothetical protein
MTTILYVVGVIWGGSVVVLAVGMLWCWWTDTLVCDAPEGL